MKLKRWWIVVLIPGVIGVIYLIATALPLGTSSFADSISETLLCSTLLISESRFDSVFECFSTGFSEEFAA